MKSLRVLLTIVSIFILFVSCYPPRRNVISLAGKWQFAIDSLDIGINQEWHRLELADEIILPGSMAENNKGDEPSLTTRWTGSIYDSSWFFDPRLEKYRQPGNVKFPFWLTPRKHYVGAAWYRKEVTIPQSWENKTIKLYLERPHWETIVWVDTIKQGLQNSLSTPHIFDLSKSLTPGKHSIVIRVDNRIKDINVGPDSHSLTDHTQGNWNGIAGSIKLEAMPSIHFADVKLFPDIHTKSVDVILNIRNTDDLSSLCTLRLSAKSFNSNTGRQIKSVTHEFRIATPDTTITINYAMGENVELWDEFNPELYNLTLELTDQSKNTSRKEFLFGMREFKANGTRFEVNGKPTFLRGTVECAAFPLTGYPPTDVEPWEHIFKICRDHGLNHMRFHSWCPPEAAFIAADKTGFYLQPEAASWPNHGASLGDGKPIDKYIYDETARIVDAYGNHASFVMMAAGNEPAGRNQVKYLGEYINYWKKKDQRRVYTGASIGSRWPLTPESEYIVRSEPRGLPWDERPQSLFDYEDKIAKYNVPYVAHEMGQYCVFPNFNEMKKYTGVYEPRNFQLFQEDLADHHMSDLAHDFLMASGKLQALCYKSEIEAALRTRGFAGIQLLSLNDFPGQGTALVGVQDVFWDNKGYITREEFKRFCNSTVPLTRLPKFVYTNNEIFKADIELAHFGNEALHNVSPQWEITDEHGNSLFKGTLATQDIPIANGIGLGTVEAPLLNVEKAAKLNLCVNIMKYTNSWDFWVYPATLPDINTDIFISNELDDQTKTVLQNGGSVLLLAAGKVQNGKEVVQYFRPVFWNTSWFQMRPPHTLGILCNSEHPAFADFPTDFHSNLQWWEILHKQQVMILDDFPEKFRPIVQPIDTWFLNRRLGLIFEANVINGKLLVCSADLESNPDERIVARQLLFSLKKYMASKEFQPVFTVDVETIENIFKDEDRDRFDTHTSDSPDDLIPK
ncbi:beta-glucuronidase [candidate division KSB1 bacterium]|nr:beta-glucuronidase [candidate division KSB1 bacterium]